MNIITMPLAAQLKQIASLFREANVFVFLFDYKQVNPYSLLQWKEYLHKYSKEGSLYELGCYNNDEDNYSYLAKILEDRIGESIPK